jgi:SAM-dependent methyltransferase
MMDQDRLWDHFQTKETSRFDGSVPRLAFLVAQTPVTGRLLDIGIGAGQFERAALDAGRDVHAVDASEGTIRRISTDFGLGEKARIGSVQAIPFPDEFFGCVVMSEVLEHLDDTILEQGLREVRRVLKKGGLFIGTVPAREPLEESMVYCPNCDTTFHRWGHTRAFSLETMRQTLAPHFLVRDVHERLFVNWQQLNWRGKLMGGVQAATARLGGRARNASIVFRAERP